MTCTPVHTVCDFQALTVHLGKEVNVVQPVNLVVTDQLDLQDYQASAGHRGHKDSGVLLVNGVNLALSVALVNQASFDFENIIMIHM